MSKKSCKKFEEDIDSSEVLEDDNKSIIMGLIAQLRKGTDLSRVTLPTFVLEPRSMLEKITDFMSHPDLLVRASKTSDPTQRFVEVCRFFLSGWHIKPKGVKKPYNPILGEFFRCEYNLKDGSKAMYISEQVSHHPPISAYYYSLPELGIFVTGEAHPKAKFLGNSAATVMKGYTRIVFSELNNETFEISNPNVYARGILFGKMIMEMGDQSTIKCKSLDLICELDFKTKGYFSGQYHSVTGKIKRISTGDVLYEISGVWTEELFIKGKNSSKESFFNVSKHSVIAKSVEPLDDQEWNESRKLWSKVTAGLAAKDMDAATDEKTFIENRQREETAVRQKEGLQWHPRFFNINKHDEYEFKGVKGIDYKNLSQAKEHLEKHMFAHTPPAVSPTTSAETFINEQGQKTLISERKPIAA
ncbi:Oxysterol-binding protein OBPa [Mucor circinelloides]